MAQLGSTLGFDSMREIETLWQKHRASVFPKDCHTKNVEDTMLVLLDADTAGCIQTYLARHGKLDLWRVAILGLCYRQLTIAVRGLDGEAREYFSQLESLARLVLMAVADKARKTYAKT